MHQLGECAAFESADVADREAVLALLALLPHTSRDSAWVQLKVHLLEPGCASVHLRVDVQVPLRIYASTKVAAVAVCASLLLGCFLDYFLRALFLKCHLDDRGIGLR